MGENTGVIINSKNRIFPGEKGTAAVGKEKNYGVVKLRRKYILCEARRLLCKNPVILLSFSALYFFSVSGIKYSIGLFFDIISANNDIYLRSVISDITALALTVPLVYIFYGYAVRLHESGSDENSSMAPGFISAAFIIRSYGVFYIYAWRYAAVYAAGYICLRFAVTTHDYLVYIKETGAALASMAAFTAAGIVVLITGSIMINRVYLVLHISVKEKDLPLRKAVSASVCAMRGSKSEALALKLNFIVPVLFSLIFPFTLAAFIIMPYYIAANAVFGCYVYGSYKLRLQK